MPFFRHLPEKWINADEAERLPLDISVAAQPDGDVPLAGVVSRSTTITSRLWKIVAKPDLPNGALTKLIAVLIVDSQAGILREEYMPFREPTALLARDGSIRLLRGFLLSPWALAEVDRVSGLIEATADSYIDELRSMLRSSAADQDFRWRRISNPPWFDVILEPAEAALRKMDAFQRAFQEYPRNRYMLLLEERDLWDRFADVFGNFHDLGEDGLVRPDRGPLLRYWARMLGEIAGELVMRHGPDQDRWPRMLRHDRLPGSLSGGSVEPFRLAAATPLRDPILVKYGKREVLERMLSDGEIRLSPASFYSDPSLTSAVKDEELRSHLSLDPAMPFGPGPPGTVLLPMGRRSTVREVGTDFYVFCLSFRLRPRLLRDFREEAALVVREPEVFLERIAHGSARSMRGWAFRADEVEYFDPLQTQSIELDPPFSKHFRHAYQREYRLAWVPREPIVLSDYRYVFAGDLRDIAELVLPSATDKLSPSDPCEPDVS